MIGFMGSCFPDKKTQEKIDNLATKVDENYEELDQRLEGVTTDIDDTVDAAIERSKVITYPEQRILCSFEGPNYQLNNYAVCVPLGGSLTNISEFKSYGTFKYDSSATGTLIIQFWNSDFSSSVALSDVNITGAGEYSLNLTLTSGVSLSPAYAVFNFIPFDGYSSDLEFTLSGIKFRFDKIYRDRTRSISTYTPEGMTYDAATVVNITKDSDDVLLDLSHREYRVLSTDISQPGDIRTYISSSSNYSHVEFCVGRVGASVTVDVMLELASSALGGQYIEVGNVAKVLYNTTSPTDEQIANACPFVSQNLACMVWGADSQGVHMLPAYGRIGVDGKLEVVLHTNSPQGSWLILHTSYLNKAYPSHEIDSQLRIVSN